MPPFASAIRVAMMYHTTDLLTLLSDAERVMMDSGLLQRGDLVVITSGEPVGKSRWHEHHEDRGGSETTCRACLQVLIAIPSSPKYR